MKIDLAVQRRDGSELCRYQVEYQDAQIKVSLLSYASQGDLITHCERATISELMARQDERAQELERLESLGKTCISQALERALSLCRAGELTAISLHSDGFANDPRYSAERARGGWDVLTHW